MTRFPYFRRSRARRLLAAVTTTMLLLISAGLMMPGSATAAGPDTSEPGYWVVASPTTAVGELADDLSKRGYDVMEGLSRDGAPILATAAQAQRLRRDSLSVRYTGPLYQPVPVSVQAAAGTYYGGYHTAAAHETHNQQVVTAHLELAVLKTIGQS